MLHCHVSAAPLDAKCSERHAAVPSRPVVVPLSMQRRWWACCLGYSADGFLQRRKRRSASSATSARNTWAIAHRDLCPSTCIHCKVAITRRRCKQKAMACAEAGEGCNDRVLQRLCAQHHVQGGHGRVLGARVGKEATGGVTVHVTDVAAARPAACLRASTACTVLPSMLACGGRASEEAAHVPLEEKVTRAGPVTVGARLIWLILGPIIRKTAKFWTCCLSLISCSSMAGTLTRLGQSRQRVVERWSAPSGWGVRPPPRGFNLPLVPFPDPSAGTGELGCDDGVDTATGAGFAGRPLPLAALHGAVGLLVAAGFADAVTAAPAPPVSGTFLGRAGLEVMLPEP